MAQAQEVLLTINNFSKGINQSVDKTLIAQYEACDAKNFENVDGVIRKKKDDAVFDSYQPALLGLKKLIRFNPASRANAAGIELYATAYYNNSAKLYQKNISNHTWDSILTLSNNVDACKLDYINYQINDFDVMILANGIDNVKVFDGSTIRDLKMNGGASSEGESNKAPKGKFVELFKERVFLTGVESEPNMVYFSTDLDPDDWVVALTEEEANQHGGYIAIPTWDSGTIIGMQALYDDLVIFKNTAVFKLTGSAPDNFVMTKIFDSSEGFIVDESIKSVDNMVFWATTNGIYTFDGTDVAKVSDRISTFYDTLPPTYVRNMVAEIYDNRYILAVTAGTDTTNNKIIEFNFKNKSFMIYEPTATKINSFLKITSNQYWDEFLLYTSENDGKVYQYKAGTTYTTNAVWESGKVSFDSLNTVKNCSKIYVLGSGVGTVRFTLSSEKKTAYKDVVLNKTAIEPFNVKLKGKGRAVSLKVECGSGSHVEIAKIQIVFELDYD